MLFEVGRLLALQALVVVAAGGHVVWRGWKGEEEKQREGEQTADGAPDQEPLAVLLEPLLRLREDGLPVMKRR